MKKSNRYTSEFRERAIRLVTTPGKIHEHARIYRLVTTPGKIHEHARIYRLRSAAGSQILNFMS